jgi:protein SCO1/2
MRRVTLQILLTLAGILTLAPGSARASFFNGQLEDRRAAGGSADGTPKEYQNVGIDEHRGAQLPLDATFTDENGKAVTLRDYFSDGKPVILQLGYFGCPMLCDQVSKGTLDSVKGIDLKIGSDFKILHISFDPKETWHDGNLKKQGFLKLYGQPGAAAGWHFLVGDPNNIRAVSEAVGFRYNWIDSAQQYSHAAAIMLLTADGHVSRYLYGVQFPEKTLRLSLVEASQNKIGSAMDQILLFCFHYDQHAGKYTLAAMNLMRLGGAVTVLVLICTLVPLYRRESRRSRVGGASDAEGKASAANSSENDAVA